MSTDHTDLGSLPLPQGNQPDLISADPLLELLDRLLGQGRPWCPLLLAGRPTVPCPLGAVGGCAWHLYSPPYRNCFLYYLSAVESAEWPTPPQAAAMLGVSPERLRQLQTKALDRFRAAGGTDDARNLL